MLFSINQGFITNIHKIGYEKCMRCAGTIYLNCGGNNGHVYLYEKELNNYIFGWELRDPNWLTNPAISYFGDSHEMIATGDDDAMKVLRRYYGVGIESGRGVVLQNNMYCR